MRRSFVLAVLAAAAATGAGVALGAAGAGASAEQLPRGGLHTGRGYFAVPCQFSHRNQDDPIVFPGRPGRSHDHTYFGNTSTDANSTPASLSASHSAAPTNAATIDAVNTRGTVLVASGVARQTYQADRQTNA